MMHLICSAATLTVLSASDVAVSDRWSLQRANAWYEEQPWLVGCNFIPSTAINQLEMWQADTFDLETMERELGWAKEFGFNTIRVYLHDLLWEEDSTGFVKRMDTFLALAQRHGIRPILVLFDDCWNDAPKLGNQPEPIPSIHNSGWLQGPGSAVVNQPEAWGRLEGYVKGVLGAFARDPRVLMWDLYNEPGNSGQGEKTLPLLKQVFLWARQIAPEQPLTVGVWFDNAALNEFQLANSDIITFHNYDVLDSLTDQIDRLRQHERPLICTEWLLRGKSDVASHLPVFKQERVGCLNWGLVAGKTQTIWPWGGERDAPVPELWFHDLLHKDGRPFSETEREIFVALTGRQ